MIFSIAKVVKDGSIVKSTLVINALIDSEIWTFYTPPAAAPGAVE